LATPPTPERFLQFAEAHAWKIDPAAIEPRELNWDAYDAVPDLARGANP
jgi:hypothetical protein